MKLVDEKGRLFGIVNPLDLVILLAVLLLVTGLATKTKTIVQAKETEVQFEAIFKRVAPEVAANLNANEPLLAAGALVDPKDAHVDSIRVVPTRSSQPNAQGQLVLTDDPYLKDVYVTVRGISRSATDDLKVAAQEIKSGKEYYYKTQRVQLLGTVGGVTVLNGK
ncbi:DUF4330 domain-containing protein [Heliobacterium chlorum]|uniref:DUF4330 domain-containing protein n=1 Tax=Heliobacterium chlorum TaxID=2698 RepID=A0ABR7T2Q0_HELCL|nr:DUF4330 domain-containing protein [Heliobacterium chlorum]